MSNTLPQAELSEDELYPYSDGQPIGETDYHIDEILALRSALGRFLLARADAYVAANNFLYYQQGSPRAVVSPDGYVVFGVEKRRRKSYMTWREGGITPAVVFEITSASTQKADVETKFRVYEQVLKVPEYFLFDPTGDYLNPRLQGYRLVESRYVSIQPETTPLPHLTSERQPAYRLHSEQLGLDLTYADDHLRLYNSLNGELIPSDMELAQQVEEELRRVTEAQQRADAEAQRATMEAKRADVEAQRAAAAEEALARLQAELDALKRGK